MFTSLQPTQYNHHTCTYCSTLQQGNRSKITLAEMEHGSVSVGVGMFTRTQAFIACNPYTMKLYTLPTLNVQWQSQRKEKSHECIWITHKSRRMQQPQSTRRVRIPLYIYTLTGIGDPTSLGGRKGPLLISASCTDATNTL